MSSSNFASFAPYTPPPDDPIYMPAVTATQSSARPWFPADSSAMNTSYQAGGVPTFATSLSGGQVTAEAAETTQNQWETRYGMRVDVLAAIAYLLGPVSALCLLIIETQNDFVRFHAYQSALLTTPLAVIRILASLLGFFPWLRSFLTLLLISSQLYMAFRVYRDASQEGLERYVLPIIGVVASQWLAEDCLEEFAK